MLILIVVANIEGRPHPPSCLEKQLFIPDVLWSNVLEWAHAWLSTRNQAYLSVVAMVSRLFQCRIDHSQVPWTSSWGFHSLMERLSSPLWLNVLARWSTFVSLPKLPSSKEAIRLMIPTCFSSAWSLIDAVSHQGPQFLSIFWRVFSHQSLPVYCLAAHSQISSQPKRMNQEMETALPCIMSHNPSSWSSHLVKVKNAQNSLTSSAIELSPLQCLRMPDFPVFNPGQRHLLSS